MAEPATPMFHSLDDFLAWEEKQELRYELLQSGVITMMAGGTIDYAQITTNLAVALQPRLRERPCFVYISGAKVVSREKGTIVYPDVVVRCGAIGGKTTSVDDPIVVFEILSDSTMKHDFTRKRQVYMAMLSVQVLVYVSQDEYRMDVFRRSAGGVFAVEVLEGRDAVLTLPEIGTELGLAEIYVATSLAEDSGETA